MIDELNELIATRGAVEANLHNQMRRAIRLTDTTREDLAALITLSAETRFTEGMRDELAELWSKHFSGDIVDAAMGATSEVNNWLAYRDQ